MKKGGSLIRFLRSSGIFFLGTVSSKIITFLMLPLYTSLIHTEDMGYYDISITYMNIAVSIIYFEIWSAVLRYMYDSDDENRKFSSAKSGLTIFGVSSLVFVAGISILGVVASVDYWYLIAIYGVMQCLVSFYTFSARGLARNVDFAISGVLSVFTNACVNIIQIVVFNMGFTAMYYGYITGALVQILYLELRIGILRKTLGSVFDKEMTKRMLIYSLPLCLNTVAYWMMTGFNKIVINIYLGDSANGLFAIGNRFGTLITFVTTCFTYAWQDLSFSKAKDSEDRAAFYSKACNVYSKFLLVGMLLLIPVCYWVFEIMINGDYQEAKSTIPTFLCVAVVSAISSFIGNVYYAIKETKVLFISTVTSAVINAAIVFPLVSHFGLNGANFAAIIGFVCNIILRSIVLYKKIKFKIEWLVQAALIVIWVAQFVAFGHLNWLSSIILLLINVVIAVVLFRKEIKNIFSKNIPANGARGE